jgi:hypothetical protein
MSDKPAFKVSSTIGTTVLGGILVLVGILFLVGQSVSLIFDFDIGHYAWPFFVVAVGVVMFVASLILERRPGLGLAMAGGIITTSGLILLIQNTFDIFSTWAYAWALVAPGSVGLAKLVYGAVRGLGDEVRSGLRLAGIGLALFVFGGMFFELVIGLNGFRLGLAWLGWPALLIGLGVILLVSNLQPRRNRPSDQNE